MQEIPSSLSQLWISAYNDLFDVLFYKISLITIPGVHDVISYELTEKFQNILISELLFSDFSTTVGLNKTLFTKILDEIPRVLYIYDSVLIQQTYGKTTCILLKTNYAKNEPTAIYKYEYIHTGC